MHLAFGGSVGEVERAAIDHQVIHGKTCRLCAGGGIRRTQPRQHVVKVIVATATVGYPPVWGVDFDGIDNRGQPQQRLQLCVHVDTGNFQLGGSLRRVCGRNANVAQREFERPGSKRNASEGERAPQRFTSALFNLGLEQGRHRQPGQDPQCHQAPQRYQRAFDPT